ncbi:hypothetical protein M8C21_023970 [Ambrosia artemisiifolia]|uniref:SCP domain-containing protein n=1 Tax=Ambrosia artemisiifolia TaxID=4212 RepID=A0AAD5CUC7_AMBAR|nr:hypothetical protein M8C21_023970 [Ambrosia artemisiifolia]
MPPLVWDTGLARYADLYARQRRQDCLLKHSNGPFGENIFWGSGDGWTPAQASMAWVAEQRWYRYGSNSCTGGRECGHYTQIVWKKTKKIGCARVTCFGGRVEKSEWAMAMNGNEKRVESGQTTTTISGYTAVMGG